MKKKLLMLSVFALATTAMASATLKEEVSYDFKETPTDVNAIKDNGSEDTTKQDHPLVEVHTPKAVTSLNVDTDLVKTDLSFLLKRDFTYTPTNVRKLDNLGLRRVNNLNDGQTVSDLYGDAELTYKLNDNLTAKGFLHYNQNKKIHDKDNVQGAVKIGLDYDYAGVSGRGLLMALDPSLNSNIWNGFSITAKTNLDKFELTGDAFGLFNFYTGIITDSKNSTQDSKGIDLPRFYSELNLGAKYVNGVLTSDNKLHYHSFISENSHMSSTTNQNTNEVDKFMLGGIEKFMKDHKDTDTLPELDLKYTSENTYKYNDKVTLTGNGLLEYKINALTINTTTNSTSGTKYSKEVNKDADYIIDVKPGFKYEDQMDALKLTVTGDAEMSYDYNRNFDTIMTDELSYKSYSDSHKFVTKPGVEVKGEYKVNDELTATGHAGLGSDIEYTKGNSYNISKTNSPIVVYSEDLTVTKLGANPSLGLGMKYMNSPLTASVNANVSNTNTFVTIKNHDESGEVIENEVNEKKVAKVVKSTYALENKGTNADLKIDYKVNDQISVGAETSLNMKFSNERVNSYDKDSNLTIKGDETTIFKLTDNGLDGDKKAKTFFSIYGSYMPMSSLTSTVTGKIELETTRTRIDSFTQSDKFKLDHYTIQNQINELIPSLELKADYTILEGLKLGAKTSIGATFGNDGYLYSYDSTGKLTNVTGNEYDVKKAEKINFKELRYNLGLTLSYEW